MINVNTEFFKRTAPLHKLAILETTTDSDLLSISYNTILRMIKEAGTPTDSKKIRCKFKKLYLDSETAHNNWNSRIYSIENYKKDEVYLDVWIGGDTTDHSDWYPLKKFLSNRFYRQDLIKFEETDRYGHVSNHYGTYDKDDSVNVIRAIIKAYIESKYKDKIKEDKKKEEEKQKAKEEKKAKKVVPVKVTKILEYCFTIPDYEHAGDLSYGEQDVRENCPHAFDIESFEEEDFEAESDYEEDYGELDEHIYQGYVKFKINSEYKKEVDNLCW